MKRTLTRPAMMLALSVLVSLPAIPATTHADSFSYLILGGPKGFSTNCEDLLTPGGYNVIVSLNLSAPARYLKIQEPSSAWGGLSITWSRPVSGSNDERTVDLGGCVSGSIELFSAGFYYSDCPKLVDGPGPTWDPEATPPVLIGCDGESRYVVPPCSTPAPVLGVPANGASVSQTPSLSWSHFIPQTCTNYTGVAVFWIEYGTDATNFTEAVPTIEETSWQLPLLLPGTEYFWRVKVVDGNGYYSGTQINYSETRSFITTGPVATQPSTWGHVKAIYRN